MPAKKKATTAAPEIIYLGGRAHIKCAGCNGINRPHLVKLCSCGLTLCRPCRRRQPHKTHNARGSIPQP